MSSPIDRFIDYKRHQQGLAPRTIAAYKLALGRLYEHCGEIGLDPLAVGQGVLEVFTGVWLHKRGVGRMGRRVYIASVRQFYAWLYQLREIPANPSLFLAYPSAGRSLPRMIALDHAEQLMWAPDFSTFRGVRDGAMLSLLLGCGLRVGGLVALNENNLQNYRHEEGVRLQLHVREKGDRERKLPVPKEAEMLLRVYLEHPGLTKIDRYLPDGNQVLFVSLTNTRCGPHEYSGERRRISAWAVHYIIQRYGEKAGIPREYLHPHALRHLFGTELNESEVNAVVAQELMGHQDANSTKIYTHLAMRRKTMAIDKANPLAKMKTPVSALLKQLGDR